MKSIKQSKLNQISKQHLVDSRSDELYKPFRDLSFQYRLKKFQPHSQQIEKLDQFSQNSYLPIQLKGLQISNDKTCMSKNFKKVAQRQITYQPIPQGVMKILQQQNNGPQRIVYKYSDPQSNDQNRYHYKSVANTKSFENRSNFKQNFQKRIGRIDQIQDQNQGYNLYSFLDEPLGYIRSKI